MCFLSEMLAIVRKESGKISEDITSEDIKKHFTEIPIAWDPKNKCSTIAWKRIA